MAKPHDLFLLRQGILNVALHVVDTSDLKQNFHDRSIRAAMQRTGKRAQRGRHRAVHIGERSRHDPRRKC